MNRFTACGKVVVPSGTTMHESARYFNMTEREIAEEYLSYPPLPYNQTISIDKIGIINYNALSEKSEGLLTYGSFRRISPESFPPCQDPRLDYEDTEKVSPVTIISGNIKYRTNQLLWYPLSDIAVSIMEKQGRAGRRLLPIQVLIDERNQWLVPLFNL